MFSANPSISPIGLKPLHVANGVGLGENVVGLWGNGVLFGEVGQGYKRRGQLIWPHSLPLTEPRPPAFN